MDCRAARVDLLPLLSSALEAAETRALQLHVSACRACAQRCTELAGLLALLRPPMLPPPPAAWKRLAARLAPQTPFELPGYTLGARLAARPGVALYRGAKGDGRPVLIRVFTLPPSTPENAMRSFAPPVHPSQVGLLDSARRGPFAYEVLEHVAGHSLTGLLTDAPLAPARVRALLTELAEALAGWHAAGRVHGALRPSNVMVGPAGRLRLLPPPPPGWEPDITSLHVLSFLAPEQLAGPPDPRSDLYALGMLGAVFLSRAWPWGEDPALALRRLRDPREDPAALPDDDAALTELLEDLTVHDARFRPRDLAEVLARLRVAPPPLPVSCEKRGDPAPGTVLFRRYRLLEQLGIGGMGTVYRVEHTMLRRERALKVVNPGVLSGGPEGLQRFCREILLLSRLQHPNICQLYDAGHDGEHFYMAMELLEGEELAALLEREGPLPVPRAVAITRQILAALALAHRSSVVHRDLKPENVMLTGDDRVKLLDFGVARTLADEQGVFRTSLGLISGTPAYMAPEQCSDGPSDPRSDLYAVGVMLFEMVTGRLPFQAKNPIALIGLHVTEPPPRLADAAPERAFPPELEELVARLLAKQPDERPPDAAAVSRALDGIGAALQPKPGLWTRLWRWLRG